MSWFEATDCPCNSLALNGLQMSCCMPSPALDGAMELFEAAVQRGTGAIEEQASIIGATSASCWMELLYKLEPRKRFRDLLIVGSHNTGSYTIHPHRPFSAIARCQNFSVLDQLQAGVRLLDLRVGGQRGNRGHSNVSVWHGSMEGQPVMPLLQQIDQFVTDHPKEIITINLVPEYGVDFSSDQKYFVLKRIHEMFDGRLVKATDMNDLLASWTLEDMIQKGKQVLVFFHPRFCRNFKVSSTTSQQWIAEELEAEFDVLNADVWMRNPWFNTKVPNTLFQNLLRDIHTHGNKKRHQFHCSQLILTPGVGGISDVVKAMVGTNPLRPISLSQHLYKDQCLNNYLRSNSEEPWNLFLLDFIDYCPWTLRFLTALNFPTKVEICLAAFTNRSGRAIDVTEALENYVFRGRAMFLANILNDLRLKEKSDEGGTLTVAYRFGDEQQPYSVLSIPNVENSTSLLISYYATSVESVVSIPWSDGGIIYGGQILSSRTPARNLKGIAIRFKSTESSCTFDVVE